MLPNPTSINVWTRFSNSVTIFGNRMKVFVYTYCKMSSFPAIICLSSNTPIEGKIWCMRQRTGQAALSTSNQISLKYFEIWENLFSDGSAKTYVLVM